MKNMPESVRLSDGCGGLRCVRVSTKLAAAEVYLHGAHVTHFQPCGQPPVLFMSAKSWFAADKPIRGGVPICFPWFGPRKGGLPGSPHGFARLAEWQFTDAVEAGDGSVELRFELDAARTAPELWSAGLVAHYCVRIGRELRMTLNVQNTSGDPVEFEEALHTYLAVGDVRKVSIEGLGGATYEDHLAPQQNWIQGPEPIRITAETDRLYINTRSTCIVHDPAWKRRIVIEKAGSDTTVVWNPWIEKSIRMQDFGDDEWPDMLCIETCNAGPNSVTLAAGQSNSMTAIVRVE